LVAKSWKSTMSQQRSKYDINIRAVERTIGVLQAINKDGPLTMAEIAKSVEIPYPTATRFVQTLLHLGMIEKSKRHRRYKPTALAKTLSCGYHTTDDFVKIARPHLIDLTKQTGWPAAIHTRVGSSMVMLDSTHSKTSLSFSDYRPGFSMPIAMCASGLAYLGFCEKEQRNEILSQLAEYASDDLSNSYINYENDTYFKLIQEDGYTTFRRNRHSKNPGKSSSIGVPIHADGQVVGSLTLVFFSSAMKMDEALEKYLDVIQETKMKIDSEISKKGIFTPGSF